MEKTTVTFCNGAHDEQPGGKVIEFRKDGTYVEGEKDGRPGKYEFVDPQHLRIQIDGLAGEPKIVLQSNTLDICNPDGTTIEHSHRDNFNFLLHELALVVPLLLTTGRDNERAQ